MFLKKTLNFSTLIFLKCLLSYFVASYASLCLHFFFFFETVRSRHQIHFHLVTHIFVSIMWRHLCNPTFCCIILYIQLAHCDLYRTGCNSWLPYADMAHIICQLLKENCLFFLNHIEYFFYMLLSLSVIYISCCSCCCHQLVFHLEKMSVL